MKSSPDTAMAASPTPPAWAACAAPPGPAAPITLAALVMLPTTACAEPGWAGLGTVLAQSILVLAYLKATTFIGWLIGLTVLAWGYHLFIGQAAGQTDGFSDTPRLRRHAWETTKLRFVLRTLHIGLLGLTLLALLTIGIGRSMGLHEMAFRDGKVSTAHAPYGPSGKHDQDTLYADDDTWKRYAPNKRPWRHLSGMPQRARGGYASIRIDNKLGEGHVYFKLCAAGPAPCKGLRHGYLRKGAIGRMETVAAGVYEVRVRDLRDGMPYRSRVFTIGEVGARTRYADSVFSLAIADPRFGQDFRAMPDGEF